MRLESTLGWLLDHSSNRTFPDPPVCAYGLPSSFQTAGFQCGSSLEIEMAIAKCWFCAWSHCLVGRCICGQVSSSWRRQLGFLAKKSWYLVEFMMPLTLTREKQPHDIKDPPPYCTVDMRSFSYMHPSSHHWCVWPKSFIFVSSDHSTRL